MGELTLLNNVRPGLLAQGVVDGDEDHGEAVQALLADDPLGAVPGVQPHHGVHPGLEAHGQEAGAKVLGPEEDLLVGEPLVGQHRGGAPAKAVSSVYKTKRDKVNITVSNCTSKSCFCRALERDVSSQETSIICIIKE